jgi:hypothetical protein
MNYASQIQSEMISSKYTEIFPNAICHRMRSGHDVRVRGHKNGNTPLRYVGFIIVTLFLFHLLPMDHGGEDGFNICKSFFPHQTLTDVSIREVCIVFIERVCSDKKGSKHSWAIR